MVAPVESISKISSSLEEGASSEGDLTNLVKKPPPFATSLKRVMHAELGEARGDLGLVVVAVHAVFLEAGFVIPGAGDGSHLPAGWGKIPYTVADLRDQDGAKIVTLRFSVAKNYITVYGFVRGGDGPGVRLCLDAVQVAPVVVSAEKPEMSEKEEKDLFRLWKMVRDGLALPLLIDICEANELPLPPCFTRLPTEIKMRIFELLPGADIARAACAGTELRYISSDNDLWERKFQEEFGLLDGSKVEGRNWKEKFAKSWLKMVDSNKRIRRDGVAVHGMRGRFVPGPQRFPLPGIIGGDYDLFPSFGGVGPLGPRLGFPHLPGSGIGFPHLPGRRNFSPQCNLGERDPSFMDL